LWIIVAWLVYKFLGLPYTWDNMQPGFDNITLRLDRGLGDDKFTKLFHNTSLRHVQTTELDRCVVFINMG
jgi:hypothetical protein